METIMIVGGAGFIGSYLVEQLSQEGNRVIAYDICQHPSSLDVQVRQLAEHRWTRVRNYAAALYNNDVRDRDAACEAVLTYKPDVIIYLPSLLAKESDERWREALSIQIDGLRNFLEIALANNNTRRFIYNSSSFVYGHFKKIPADENHVRMPIDTYGRSKLLGEELVQAYAAKSPFTYTIIRPAGVYGFGDTHIYYERTATTLLYNAVIGKPTIVPSASTIIDFTYVKDLVRGMKMSAVSRNAENQIFNMTCGVGRTVRDFVEVVKTISPSVEVTLLDPPRSESSNAPIRGALDISKARALLSFQPEFPLEIGIKDTFTEYERYFQRHENSSS